MECHHGSTRPQAGPRRQCRLLGAARRFLRSAARFGRGRHRSKRRRQVHSAQDPGSDHIPHHRPGRATWPGRLAPRGRDRVPLRTHRPRERSAERRDPGHEARRDHAQVRRDHCLRRHRPVHRRPGEALLERHEGTSRFCRRGLSRAGDPAHRRGASRRRWRVPEEVPGQDVRDRRGRPDDHLRGSQHAGNPAVVRSSHPSRPRQSRCRRTHSPGRPPLSRIGPGPSRRARLD